MRADCKVIPGSSIVFTLVLLWHVTSASAQNILFYGNSFTIGVGFGSTESVPNIVEAIANAAGHSPTIVSAAVENKDLGWHLLNNTAVIGTSLAVGEEWDYAVLQNYSTAPTHIGDLAQHRLDTAAITQAIADHSPNFQPVLFETWARGPGHSFYAGVTPQFPGGPAEMQAELHTGYQLAAQDIAAIAGPVSVAEVGQRWQDANWENLHAPDNWHARNRGTLLAALTIYSTIYNDATGDLDLSSVLSGLGLTEDDGAFLTGIVDRAIPEPSSVVVLVCGVIVVGAGRWRY